jgi:disulfide bond formation protein DsbB
VSVPIGLFATIWGYLRLREVSASADMARIDWPGNITFAVGLILVMIGITYGIEPYGGHKTMGWTNPMVVTSMAVGVAVPRRVLHH